MFEFDLWRVRYYLLRMGIALFILALLLLMGFGHVLLLFVAGISVMFVFVFSSMAVGKFFLRN